MKSLTLLSILLASSAWAQTWNPNDSLPDCSAGTPVFNQHFIDLTKVESITPAGTVNGSDHFIPIHVMYITGKKAADGSRLHPDTPIVAPGNVLVTAVEWRKKQFFGSNRVWQTVDDWYVTIAPCKQLRFRFHHLSSLSTVGQWLAERAFHIKNGQNDGPLETWCDLPGGAAAGAKLCYGLVNANLGAGTLIGTVFFGLWDSFNLSVKDYNPLTPIPALLPGMPSATGNPPVANYDRYNLSYQELAARQSTVPSQILFDEISPSRTRDNGLYVRCHADYFSEAVRAELKSFFGKSEDPSIQPWPAGWGSMPCGRFLHDDPGKLKGSWFRDDQPTTFIPDDEATAMSLFNAPHGNAPVISIGTALTSSPLPPLTFEPNATGTINRPFNQTSYVTNGPQTLYCYDHLQPFSPGYQYRTGPNAPANLTGVVLLQFRNSDTAIQMEYQHWVSDCSSSPTFTPFPKLLKR